MGRDSFLAFHFSVTRFGAKFRHFGTILKVLEKFLLVKLVFGKMLILLWQKCYAIEQVFIVLDSDIL